MTYHEFYNAEAYTHSRADQAKNLHNQEEANSQLVDRQPHLSHRNKLEEQSCYAQPFVYLNVKFWLMKRQLVSECDELLNLNIFTSLYV